jgi:hypothetical protein
MGKRSTHWYVPNLMRSKINKHFPGDCVDRPRQAHRTAREHGLLISDIGDRIGRRLAHHQLLDRKRTRISVKPPYPTLFPASHHDHLPDRRSDIVRPGDNGRMIGQHRL